ncbi:MAG: S-methyl-5'-thioadenosine phosphorylase, partial [Pseudomonadota bacterium]
RPEETLEPVVLEDEDEIDEGLESAMAFAGQAEGLPDAEPEAGDAAEAVGTRVHRGGTYLAMEGPQFSTRAESHLYRSWGCDVIGMTNMPEAKLAREAELPYATVAMVTDYDCWREDDGAVEVAHILETMKQNASNAARLVTDVAARLGATRTSCPSGIESVLDTAVITPPSARDPEFMKKLDAVAGRILTR